MKQYTQPEIEIVEFDELDILTESTIEYGVLEDTDDTWWK